MFYSGDTVRLVGEISEHAMPAHLEGTVREVVRNEDGGPVAARVEFYINSKYVTQTVPLDSIEPVISSGFGHCGVFWGLQKPPEQFIEDAMNAMLDSGFEMRRGPNVLQLRYNREDRFWGKQDRITDPTGAQVVTNASLWDGCIVAFSGTQRFHLEFRIAGRHGPCVLIHERFEAYYEHRLKTHSAMVLMRLMFRLSGALNATFCAMPVAGNWLMDESWDSLLQQPFFPDFFIVPQARVPDDLPPLFRTQKMTDGSAVLTSLPVKFSPGETPQERSDRDLKLNALRACKSLGEKAYDQMYDAHSAGAATGLYSDAKEAFYDAISLANELGLKDESEALEKRLTHIKAVFRSQFT